MCVCVCVCVCVGGGGSYCSFLGKPLTLVIFQVVVGGGLDPLSPSGSAHDPAEIPQPVAFYMSVHFLSKYPFVCFQYKKVPPGNSVLTAFVNSNVFLLVANKVVI